MDLLNELARTDIDPDMLAQVRAMFEQQQTKLAQFEPLRSLVKVAPLRRKWVAP